MKTPSKYPVLDNRPIDQWKVPELKEELKRRKLTVGGLKQDLIKRLDEAIRAEREAAETEHNNGFEESNAGIATDNAEKTTEQAVSDTGEAGIGVADNVEKTADDADKKSAEVVVVPDPADSKDNSQQQSEDRSLEEEMSESVTDNAAGISMLTATDMPSAEMDNKVCDGSSFAIAMAGPELHDDEMERDNEDSGAQLDSEDLKLPHEDMKLSSSDPTNQVSEVSTNLGFPVKSDSISTDSVSVCEKNDLEDNIITDNVKLELDVKPEMVQPSSSNLAPDGGKSHPTDVEEPHENKISVEETDNNVIAEMSQRNHSADLCSSEKLNLDRSSGDDSLEEDALESKQIDSNFNSEEVGERPLKSEATSRKGDSLSASMDTDLPTGDKSIHVENKDVVAALSEKRKLPEPEAVVNNEPSKRLRRWKSENNKVREPHISTPVALAKDVTPSAVLRRNLSGSNSVGSNDSSKEREVPPSTKAPTNSLRIDRFIRPFTLKAVQELLGKTGTVSSFWMDHIKTHCYVTYSSVEEAVATRNAVYNLQWPPNGGRNLIADFVDPQEVKMRVEAPSKPSAAPANSAPTVAPEPLMLPQPSPRQQNLLQQMPQPTLPPPPPLSNPGQARERGHPPPPPVQEKVEASIVTLDDLFRKTKATPRVYYLPLSEEQVSAKVEARLKNPRQ